MCAPQWRGRTRIVSGNQNRIHQITVKSLGSACDEKNIKRESRSRGKRIKRNSNLTSLHTTQATCFAICAPTLHSLCLHPSTRIIKKLFQIEKRLIFLFHLDVRRQVSAECSYCFICMSSHVQRECHYVGMDALCVCVLF